MSEIIPAIMPVDYDDLVAYVDEVRGHAPMVQIDIMDGKFVEGVTWPFNVHDEPNFQSIMREEDGMYCWDSVDYELDLMIEYPDENLEQWLALGPKRLVLHIESLKNPTDAFDFLQSVREFAEIGLSFNNDFDLEKLGQYVDFVDFVQCMGIAEIGKQGEPFDERVLDSIEYIRENFPTLPIAVDGSVNEETLEELKKAGATRFVAGSAVFDGDPVQNIEMLETLLG